MKKTKTPEPSEAVKLAQAGQLDAESAEPIWKLAAANLPKGERPPFRQSTFTLHDRQWEIVKQALKKAKDSGAKSTLNKNSNGNALTAICRAFLAEPGQAAHRRARASK